MRVGFIGLGAMGRPMAINLLRGGHAVTVHARRAASRGPLPFAGGAAGVGGAGGRIAAAGTSVAGSRSAKR